ncbi:hypothetical protein SH580_00845 [Coraliomargarita algicola]|uniref:Uncharacterized protein n=1 Tax=Coraliomargarita algicola TaxID=3092156 RepID=A0ABZ0RMC4_9BACT|nr:hypothetical protein [Coraliomargarita sp. J2-16]WPJ96248.1 hypothetical protein SH580_00845 [Coraliomargarita sp. J2-16]
MKSLTKLLLLSCVMVVMYQSASAEMKDDFAHEPSSAKEVQAKRVAEPDWNQEVGYLAG